MSQAGERDSSKRVAVRKAKIEARIGELATWAIFSFLLMMFIATCTGCSGMTFRLPDRDHPNCAIGWEQRPVCIDSSDCAESFLCAKRGTSVGRCTYIDCCDPWRNRGLYPDSSFCEDLQSEQTVGKLVNILLDMMIKTLSNPNTQWEIAKLTVRFVLSLLVMVDKLRYTFKRIQPMLAKGGLQWAWFVGQG